MTGFKIFFRRHVSLPFLLLGNATIKGVGLEGGEAPRIAWREVWRDAVIIKKTGSLRGFAPQ